MDNVPLRGALYDQELNICYWQGIAVDQEGRVKEIGDFDKLEATYPHAKKVLIDGRSKVALPAFVDCHTHICWGGTRVNDYAMRVAGKSYLEIAAAGGGIMDTVLATRKASEEDLVKQMLERVNEHLRRGITTIEVKSGYGLSLQDELKMLRSITRVNRQTPATIIPTFLGAHIKPADFKGNHLKYLNFLLEEVAPIVLQEQLATRADIFVEEGAFGLEEARYYARRMMEMGFDVTMHVDQFHAGGAKMAAEIGCVSADHLEVADEESINALGNAQTVAVALPGASLGLGMPFAPARELLNNNACLAIATDWNPGSAPMGDLLTQAAVLGASEKLTIAETLAGITVRAAHALRIDAGTISPGKKAHIVVFETEDYREIFYRQGQLQPGATIIGNTIITHD